jgi:hypothetical protein
MPLGWDWGIANIRHQSPAVPAIEQWYVYAPTLDGLLTTLESVLGDFRSLVLPFYCEATTFLRKDVLLQTAIRERVYMARPDKKELQDALAAVDYRLDRLEHPAYVQLRDRLRLRWKDVTKEKRGWTNRVAIDSLLLL